MNRLGCCPFNERIEHYLLGRLAEPDSGRLEEHLLFCQPCQDAAGDGLVYLRSLRTVLCEVPARNRR